MYTRIVGKLISRYEDTKYVAKCNAPFFVNYYCLQFIYRISDGIKVFVQIYQKITHIRIALIGAYFKVFSNHVANHFKNVLIVKRVIIFAFESSSILFMDLVSYLSGFISLTIYYL